MLEIFSELTSFFVKTVKVMFSGCLKSFPLEFTHVSYRASTGVVHQISLWTKLYNQNMLWSIPVAQTVEHGHQPNA